MVRYHAGSRAEAEDEEKHLKDITKLLDNSEEFVQGQAGEVDQKKMDAIKSEMLRQIGMETCEKNLAANQEKVGVVQSVLIIDRAALLLQVSDNKGGSSDDIKIFGLANKVGRAIVLICVGSVGTGEHFLSRSQPGVKPGLGVGRWVAGLQS